MGDSLPISSVSFLLFQAQIIIRGAVLAKGQIVSDKTRDQNFR